MLGSDLSLDGERDLRMRDAATGENLWWAVESEAVRRKAEVRADQQARRRLAREARLAELEQRLESTG